jgi:hypothetical protein
LPCWREVSCSTSATESGAAVGSQARMLSCRLRSFCSSWALGARVGTQQGFGLEVANLDAVLEDAHQHQGANGGRACGVAAVVNAHAGVVVDGALGLGEILHAHDGQGLQVGIPEASVRININVLKAQTALFNTKATLAKARYDVLLGGLKLRQANGSLKADNLNAVNALLAK